MAKKKIEAWQKLDNSAIIFPFMSGKRNQNNFRMQVTLCEAVDKDVLEEAINEVLPRFPQYNVTLARGALWYYFKRNTNRFRVSEVSDCGMAPLPIFKKGCFPFRFSVQGNDIYGDFFHALGDGAGTGEFLKSVVYTYLTRRGYKLEDEGKVILPLSPVDPAESEDAFRKYYKPLPVKELEIKSMQGKNAFIIEGDKWENGGVENVQYTLNAKEIVDLCHNIGCTVTEYLGAAFAMAIYRGMIEGKKKKSRNIQLFMPINLRRMFPSRTLKNFSLFSRVTIDTRTPPTMEKCIQVIHESLKRDTDKALLERKISTTVRAEVLGIMQVVPLFLKKAVLKISNLFFGKGKKTATFSNVGIVRLPESMRPYVKDMFFSLWPNSNAPYTAVVVSVWDNLNITFNKRVKGKNIELELAKQFVADKLRYLTRSRLWSGNKA